MKCRLDSFEYMIAGPADDDGISYSGQFLDYGPCGLDELLDAHVPFLVHHRLGHGVGGGRTIGQGLRQGQGIVGSKMGDMVIKRDIPWIVDMYQQGRLKLDELISGRWTLDQINEGFELMHKGESIRAVVEF